MTGSDRATLRQLVEEGNDEAADRLAYLASQDGDVETLKRTFIDAGNESAGDLLAHLAAERATSRRLSI